MKYQKRGVEWPCPWHSPCYGSLELRGGVVCPSCFLARAVCVLEGGVGGMVGYKVATLGMMLLAMVLMLARVAKPGQY